MMCENSSAAACPYDVGDILTTASAIDPAARWPGTEWTQIKDRFLLGAGDKHAISSTGGSETHTLTQDELPEISGSIYAGNGAVWPEKNGMGVFRSTGGVFTARQEMENGPGSQDTEPWPSGRAYAYVDMAFGGGQAHTNMPPYTTVYIWQRTK